MVLWTAFSPAQIIRNILVRRDYDGDTSFPGFELFFIINTKAEVILIQDDLETMGLKAIREPGLPSQTVSVDEQDPVSILRV